MRDRGLTRGGSATDSAPWRTHAEPRGAEFGYRLNLTGGQAGSAREIVIQAPGRWEGVDLREVWSYRELLGIFVWRDLKVRYRHTVLGGLWVVGQPLLMMLIFSLLFHRIGRIQSGGDVPYDLFVLSGLLVWTLFSSGLQGCGNSVLGNSHMITKVYFPRLIIPVSSIAGVLVDFCVSFGLLVLLMVWHRVWPGSTVVFAGPVVLVAVALALGLGLWVAALNVEYRDLRVVMPFVMQIWLFTTPVLYPIEVLPPAYQLLARVNPVTGVIQGFRGALLGLPMDWDALLSSVLWASVLLIGGAWYFVKMEKTFADRL